MSEQPLLRPLSSVFRCLILLLPAFGLLFPTPLMAEISSGPAWKILHIMSYHSPWKWTDDQLSGFKHALQGLNIDYRVFQLDTKRKSSPEWKKKKGIAARNLIDTWHPDLVYIDDDNAQSLVTRYYANRKTPFVFSGVNDDPSEYGIANSTNITGVVEKEHYLQTLRLLKAIVPSVRKIAIIVDDDPTWDGVISRINHYQTLPENLVLDHIYRILSFDAYKKLILKLQNKEDALGILGIFTFKDSTGKNTPYQNVLRWTVDNSRLPDFSFWKDRIDFGTLCAVTVSGYEQGLAAGKMAWRILVDHVAPGKIPITSTVKGEPVISLARANKLNIPIKSSLLLSADIITKFSWDR